MFPLSPIHYTFSQFIRCSLSRATSLTYKVVHLNCISHHLLLPATMNRAIGYRENGCTVLVQKIALGISYSVYLVQMCIFLLVIVFVLARSRQPKEQPNTSFLSQDSNSTRTDVDFEAEQSKELDGCAHLKVKSSGNDDGRMHQMPSVSSSRGRPI